MNATTPVDVIVDIAELGRVHTELQTTIGRLDELDRATTFDQDQLGGAEVAQAVAGFVQQWSRERHRLTGHLHDCAAYVEHAEQEYGRTETNLVNVLTSGTGGATP
jgi:hypothetical protein